MRPHRTAELSDGRTVPLTEDLRARLRAKFEQMAERPLRCLALAVKEQRLGVLANVKSSSEFGTAAGILSDPSRFADVEQGLVLVGMVGIKDPARPEVRRKGTGRGGAGWREGGGEGEKGGGGKGKARRGDEGSKQMAATVAASIEKCRDAGIRVIMITGDSAATATAIARDVHILEQPEQEGQAKQVVFEGSSFFDLPEARLPTDPIAGIISPPPHSPFAHHAALSPPLPSLAHDMEEQNRLLLTKNLVFCRAEPADKQRLVKQLQALGEVAAMTGDGAADMVLADDNFATIVTAVEEGRSIYANMKSFINFLITCNIGEVMAVFLSTLAGLPEVLGPLHLLWVNLVTDGPPATALGFNPPDPHNMQRKPRGSQGSCMVYAVVLVVLTKDGVRSAWLRDMRYEQLSYQWSDSLVSKFTLLRYVITGSYVGIATVGAFVAKYRQM
ncbi:MAG: hypothetical protein SGPRY_011024, partial [Prymnesium sp.]